MLLVARGQSEDVTIKVVSIKFSVLGLRFSFLGRYKL